MMITDTLNDISIEVSAVSNPFYLGCEGVWYLRTESPEKDIPVTRSYVILILDRVFATISPDDAADLLFPTMSAQIREQFAVSQNLSLEEVEQRVAGMYEDAIDPLPVLRSILGDLCDVVDTEPTGVPLRSTLFVRRENDGRAFLREVWMS